MIVRRTTAPGVLQHGRAGHHTSAGTKRRGRQAETARPLRSQHSSTQGCFTSNTHVRSTGTSDQPYPIPQWWPSVASRATTVSVPPRPPVAPPAAAYNELGLPRAQGRLKFTPAYLHLTACSETGCQPMTGICRSSSVVAVCGLQGHNGERRHHVPRTCHPQLQGAPDVLPKSSDQPSGGHLLAAIAKACIT